MAYLYIKVQHRIPDETFRWIAINAIESGILYWCSHVTVEVSPRFRKAQLPRPIWYSDMTFWHSERWRLRFHSAEEENLSWPLTKPQLRKGIAKLALERGDIFYRLLKGSHDYFDADHLFQLAVFGEVRFA